MIDSLAYNLIVAIAHILNNISRFCIQTLFCFIDGKEAQLSDMLLNVIYIKCPCHGQNMP